MPAKGGWYNDVAGTTTVLQSLKESEPAQRRKGRAFVPHIGRPLVRKLLNTSQSSFYILFPGLNSQPSPVLLGLDQSAFKSASLKAAGLTPRKPQTRMTFPYDFAIRAWKSQDFKPNNSFKLPIVRSSKSSARTQARARKNWDGPVRSESR